MEVEWTKRMNLVKERCSKETKLLYEFINYHVWNVTFSTYKLLSNQWKLISYTAVQVCTSHKAETNDWLLLLQIPLPLLNVSIDISTKMFLLQSINFPIHQVQWTYKWTPRQWSNKIFRPPTLTSHLILIISLFLITIGFENSTTSSRKSPWKPVHIHT